MNYKSLVGFVNATRGSVIIKGKEPVGFKKTKKARNTIII